MRYHYFHLGYPLTPIPRLTVGYIKISKNGKSIKMYILFIIYHFKAYFMLSLNVLLFLLFVSPRTLFRDFRLLIYPAVNP